MDVSFVKAPVEVPKLSGFDKSHQHLLSAKVGTLVPVLCDELIPGTKVNLKIAASAALPPLASDTYMRVQLKMEAFFVPMRLLVGSFESWFCQQAVPTNQGSGVVDAQGVLPRIIVNSGPNDEDTAFVNQRFSMPGTLSDYLGCSRYQGAQFGVGTSDLELSFLPYLAYGKVFDDWYRAPLVQKSLFSRFVSVQSTSLRAHCFPSFFFSAGSTSVSWYAYNPALVWADGTSIFDLRQRNFGLDYFTTAMPSPQLGSAQSVSFSTASTTGQFSIASLRAANSLQQFAERNALAGTRYQDSLHGRYGVNLSNGVAQRSLLLGSSSFDVYTKGISQNSPATTADSSTTNPFKAIGATYGSARASGSDFVISGFQADEPGYLFVIASLVPKVTYSTGIRRYLRHYISGTAADITDMANPILQNVGPQPIYASELLGVVPTGNPVFGYTDRYAEYKTMEDKLSGILRDGYSLESFALQRSFTPAGGNPTINSAFLQIPTNYMDQVTAVSNQISSFGYWLDCYFDYKVAMPLARYSLPSLQDPAYEHGKTVIVNKGGVRL